MKRKTVYVAMSGGVDSSVAAALLKKQGFSVVGVYMKPWQPDRGDVVCMWKRDREDALRVASHLDIPLYTWDFSRQYKKSVADYMIREYKAGRTPNPDVMCNKDIKFGLFLQTALKKGADAVATGHYIAKKGTRLFTAHDAQKDQSYFLWTLTPREIKHCLFPLGSYTKPQIRAFARKMKLPTADKKDSQGVCFVGELDMHDFLTHYIKPKPGHIVHVDGTIVGTHDGAAYYTIGQRHGLSITNGHGPYYVTGKDMKKNIVYVGTEEHLLRDTIRVADFSWTTVRPRFPMTIDVRLRYRARLKKGILTSAGALVLTTPERAVTAGQSAVFYRGAELLGGGIIQ